MDGVHGSNGPILMVKGEDWFGNFVSLSSDGTILAVGANLNGGTEQILVTRVPVVGWLVDPAGCRH